MLLLRGLGAALLWVVAGVVGLLGILLCVTIILLPLGIPVLLMAKRLFRYSMVVLMPGKVRHPARSLKKTGWFSRRRPAGRAGKRGRRD